MNARFLLLFLLLAAVSSCSKKEPLVYTSSESGSCTANSLNIYHWIKPEKTRSKLPLLIILDSGGDGKTALEKIRPALSETPCVAVGSDLVRNNYAAYVNAIDQLVSDAVLKYAANKDQVFLTGFSGGARMAYEYAKIRNVRGVLMCGAGPDSRSPGDLPCPVYLISGINDFNFAETYYNPLKMLPQQRFISDYFRGKHEWPPERLMKDAFIFLMGNSVPGGGRLLKRESKILTYEADSLLSAGEVFFSLKSTEKAISLDPGNRKAATQMENIRKNTELNSKINRIETDLYNESKLGRAYSEATLSKDSAWWANELRQLSSAISGSRGDELDHFLRIKAFLGILFYSRLNQMLHSGQPGPQIPHILAAYRMAEPENNDVYYYNGLFQFKTGNTQSCINYLVKARNLGFRDIRRLESEFPANLLSEAGF
jgi:hypothetical protein